MAPIGSNSGSPIILDCSDSGLSISSNIVGLLTFIAAIILSIQLSMGTTVRIYQTLKSMAGKHPNDGDSPRVMLGRYGPIVDDVLTHAHKYGFDSIRPNLSYDDTMNMWLSVEQWIDQFDYLYGRVRRVVLFKYRIHRPIMWLLRREDALANAQLDKLQSETEELLRSCNRICSYWEEFSASPVAEKIWEPKPHTFEARILDELAQLKSTMTLLQRDNDLKGRLFEELVRARNSTSYAPATVETLDGIHTASTPPNVGRQKGRRGSF